jgi:hypothetical protein
MSTLLERGLHALSTQASQLFGVGHFWGQRDFATTARAGIKCIDRQPIRFQFAFNQVPILSSHGRRDHLGTSLNLFRKRNNQGAPEIAVSDSRDSARHLALCRRPLVAVC